MILTIGSDHENPIFSVRHESCSRFHWRRHTSFEDETVIVALACEYFMEGLIDSDSSDVRAGEWIFY